MSTSQRKTDFVDTIQLKVDKIDRLEKAIVKANGQVKQAYLDGYNQRWANENCVRPGSKSHECTAIEAWETSEQKADLEYWGEYDDGSFQHLWDERERLQKENLRLTKDCRELARFFMGYIPDKNTQTDEECEKTFEMLLAIARGVLADPKVTF